MGTGLRVELITLGDELLNGIRENGHLAYIGEKLARHGVTLQRNISMRDEPDEIRQHFPHSLQGADIVITTGGLGPTTDDNTREVIAECLGLELEFVPEIEAAIQARFDRMGRKMSDTNRKQCYLPKGSELLPNPNGTAPGIWVEHAEKYIIMLPGPANELRPMFERIVLPRLQKAGLIEEGAAYLQFKTIGIGESSLQEVLTPIWKKHSGLVVGYCAHQGLVDVRLSAAEGSDLSSEGLKAIAEECRKLLQSDFVCYGEGNLAQTVFDHLRLNEKTLAVAESCTGGMLSNSFTDIPGASKVFAGGVVCYNNDIKTELLGVPESIIQQHGAVSAETAAAMATGAMEKFSTDYSLSITGFAGPTGGTAQNPLGTIYIGYASPVGVWSVKMHYPGERTAVKMRAVNRALDVIRRKLNKYQVQDAIQSMMTNS